MLSAISFAAELQRAAASQRVHDTMVHKAARGHVTGGECFGCTHVAVAAADGTRSHVERRLHNAEAAVVHEIFRLCAEGRGVKRIAMMLNARGAPAPRAQRCQPQGWASSSVRAVLYRDLYRGLLVWNKTRQHDAWGQRRAQRRPPSEWITMLVPELGIVSDELWAAAHRRLQVAAHTYRHHSNGTVRARPPTGLEAHRLLTGLTGAPYVGAR